MLRKAARLALRATITPPLMVAEIAFVGGVIIGMSAMMIDRALMSKEDIEEEMRLRREFLRRNPPGGGYHGV